MKQSISLDEAQRIVQAAVEESKRRGVQTAVAVVDDHGTLIALAKVDGARVYYPDVAYGKAIGSALWESNSRELARTAGTNSVQARVNALHGGRLVFAPGAVPLRRDGEVIGAVGVGGSGPDSDEQIAEIAAKLL